MSQLRVALVVFALVSAVACGPAPSESGDCTEVMPGPWGASGDAFGMEMTTTTSFSDCRATFSNWDMQMSVPEGAVVAGSAVTFTGEGWDDCTGTLSDDGMSITGQCSDGSGLEMAMQQ